LSSSGRRRFLLPRAYIFTSTTKQLPWPGSSGWSWSQWAIASLVSVWVFKGFVGSFKLGLTWNRRKGWSSIKVALSADIGKSLQRLPRPNLFFFSFLSLLFTDPQPQNRTGSISSLYGTCQCYTFQMFSCYQHSLTAKTHEWRVAALCWKVPFPVFSCTSPTFHGHILQ